MGKCFVHQFNWQARNVMETLLDYFLPLFNILNLSSCTHQLVTFPFHTVAYKSNTADFIFILRSFCPVYPSNNVCLRAAYLTNCTCADDRLLLQVRLRHTSNSKAPSRPTSKPPRPTCTPTVDNESDLWKWASPRRHHAPNKTKTMELSPADNA